MKIVFAFVAGTFFGSFVAVFALALCQAAAKGNDQP